MPVTVPFLTPNDLHDIVRGMAVVSKLYDTDPDARFRLDQEAGEALGAWKDFDGNSAHFVFSPDGSAILGFLQKSPLNPLAGAADPALVSAPPGVYDSVPAPLRERIRMALFDDLFEPEAVTFCLWNTGKGKVWQKGDVPVPAGSPADADGQQYILGRLKRFYDDFSGEFEDVYNWDLDPDAVADLLSGDRLSLALIRSLKADANPLEAKRWLPEMGFVVDGVK